MTRPVTRLRSYDLELPAAYLPEPLLVMYGGGPWRGLGVRTLLVDPQQPVSLATTHVCYPQPLTTEVLTVRGRTDADGFARAVIYNLQGETVRTTDRLAVRAGSPFDLVIDMQGVASGLYLCKLEAGGQTSVKTIAVAQ
jgi:hypothetical protein